MRNVLLGSGLLALSLAIAGCDSTAKDDKVVPQSPPVTAPGGETKPGGAMDGPAPAEKPAEPPK